MHHQARLLILFLTLCVSSIHAVDINATELHYRLTRIASVCQQRAQKLSPAHDTYRRLLHISAICLHALPTLSNTRNPVDPTFYTSLSTQLLPFTSIAIRTSPHQGGPPVTLPIHEIVRLIEEEEVELHLRPTPFQLSAKRIMFRLLSELFYVFGSHKLELEHSDETPFDQPQSNPLVCLKRSVKRELWDARSEHGLRALRIFSNQFIDHIIPNKKPTKTQEFAELLVPIIISNCVAFVISKSKDETVKDLGRRLLRDIFRRLLMVQLFIKKRNGWYFALMGFIYFLSFYNCAAGDYIWQNKMDDAPDGALARRFHYLKKMGSSWENAMSVGIDGISSLLSYAIIDRAVAKIPLPPWLLATPIQQDPHDRAERLRTRQEKDRETESNQSNPR